MNVNEMSSNGHETNGQMARRNLGIYVDRLDEMRWMVVNACGLDSVAMAAYDEGAAKLLQALNIIKAEMAKPGEPLPGQAAPAPAADTSASAGA